jgi:methionine aminopeptidase
MRAQSKPASRPTLKLINWSKKDKSILISRNDDEVHAYPSSEEPLLEGDLVTLITGVHVT